METIKNYKQFSLRKTATLSKEPKEYYEIVQWFNYDYEENRVRDGSTCYTIAIFKEEESVSMRFISDRYFNLEKLDRDNFLKLAEYSQGYIENEHLLKDW